MISIAQENSFDFTNREYADLFACADATAFQSPVWMRSFYQFIAAPRGATPLIITFREEGKLVGVVALICRKKAGLRLVETADLGVTDYACPVFSDGLLQQLRNDQSIQPEFMKAVGPHDIVRIRPLLPEHALHWQSLFNETATRLGFSAHAVDLQPPFEDWRQANLDKKLASMMARKGKRWKRQHGVMLEKIVDPANVKLAISNLAKLRRGRFDDDPIQTEVVETFYANVAASGAANGNAETWMVTSDGSIAAILFGLTHRGRFHYLLIGADYDAHGRHSPGLQMYDWIIEDWMGRGGTCFDFTIGDEPFKAQFGTSAKPMSMILKGGGIVGKLAVNLFEKRLRRATDG